MPMLSSVRRLSRGALLGAVWLLSACAIPFTRGEPTPPEPRTEGTGRPLLPPMRAEPATPAEAIVALALPPQSGAPVPLRAEAILPRKRIVAFYGNPASERMGILGELPPDQMLRRLDREVAAWERTDPTTPVQPALHMMTTVAASDPGPDSLYRNQMPDWRIAQVKEWADRRDALLFLDIQAGRSTVHAELPRLRTWLEQPDVHLALDPEWNMGRSGQPGHAIGSMTAAEINYAIRFLAELVDQHRLPPKVLVVHRFTHAMVAGARDIITDPLVQVVVNMDGWGPPAHKLDTYNVVVAPEAFQFTGSSSSTGTTSAAARG